MDCVAILIGALISAGIIGVTIGIIVDKYIHEIILQWLGPSSNYFIANCNKSC